MWRKLDRLSLWCALGLSAILTLPVGVHAQAELVNWFNPVVGQLPIHADFRAAWFPQEQVRDQNTSLGYAQEELGASFPIWQNHTDEWSGSARVRTEEFNTHAELPTTHEPFPADLWNIHLGTSYRHLFDNDWVAAANVSLGSASDKPFHSINEMVVGASAYLRVPQGEHNAWLFSLNYSTNREFLNGIPIPGVAFLWQPNDWFRAVIGVPFANVTIRALDDLTLELSYFPLTTVNAKVVYRIYGPLKVYAGFASGHEIYFLASRVDEKDRLFYYDNRVTAGLTANLAERFTIDLSTGYIFDRLYFEGRNYTERDRNRIDVGDAPFVALRAGVRF